MSVEQANPQSEEDKLRLEATLMLYQLFLLSMNVYVESIQEYGVAEECAKRQLKRLREPTRQMMWKHVRAVMALNAEYADEARPQVEIIKRVLGME